MHFADRRIKIMCFCTVKLNSRVVSSDLHAKEHPLAAGFKAYYLTELTTPSVLHQHGVTVL